MKKILIAEDEVTIGHALELKLQRSGFATKYVCNGEEAMSAIKKEDFDLILLDLIMPKMTGFEVLESLKKMKSKTPVIVTSNLGQIEDVARAKALGAVDYCIKADISLQAIVELIEKYLQR